MKGDNIWNTIWQADMRTNGLIPLVKDISENEKNDYFGYIIIDSNPIENTEESYKERKIEHLHNNISRNIKVFNEVKIPKNKEYSYKLIENLFNKLYINNNLIHISNPEKIEEINDFINFAITTEPMKIARNYLESKNKISPSTSTTEWGQYLLDIWFKPYYKDNTTAFEHIFLGKQGTKQQILSGHHFWYHYYLHDIPLENIQYENSTYFIRYVEINHSKLSKKAEVVTLKYTYKTSDETMPQGRLLYKDIGSFFVGISAECLLALGTIANIDDRETLPISINNINFEIKNFEADKNHNYFKTFYPIIKKNNSSTSTNIIGRFKKVYSKI